MLMIRQHWEVKDPLVVISGLGVVKNRKGKLLSHTRLQVSGSFLEVWQGTYA